MNELLLQGLSELGLDVSRAETLERFSSLLLEKNEVMNLTAITEPDAVAQLHLLDSAAILQFVDLKGKTVVDVGTLSIMHDAFLSGGSLFPAQEEKHHRRGRKRR